MKAGREPLRPFSFSGATDKTGQNRFGLNLEANTLDSHLAEWGMTEPSDLNSAVRRVLGELNAEGLLALKDRRLEVMVIPEHWAGVKIGPSVHAYFPIHRLRCVAKALHPRSETRVLLVFTVAEFEKEPGEAFDRYLRDHLGHVLLYLRSPKANNRCGPAMKEWNEASSSQHA